MFQETSPQEDLFALQRQLPERVRERLKDTWAHGFATKVMPVLLEVESEFADLYDADQGRPAWSVARKLGICLLQHMFDYHDQEALDNLAYDVRWQYALGVPPEEAYLSRRSLVEFRSRLVEFDPEMQLVEEVFERVTRAALEDLDLETAHQRCDATLIVSNIQTRGREWLFGETLRKFLADLKDIRPDAYQKLPDGLGEWAHERLEEDGWFAQGNEQRVSLETLAEWLVWLRQAYRDDQQLAGLESYRRVERLIDEQCDRQPADHTEAETDDEQPAPTAEVDDPTGVAADEDVEDLEVEVRDEPKNGGASMQTPHDPDATYGQKGVGYKVHLSETVGHEEGTPEILTDYWVTGADKSDRGKMDPIYDRLDERGWCPEVMFADGGYPTAESILEARESDSRLHTPVTKRRLPDEYVGREAFEFDQEGKVQKCPEGYAPLEHTYRKRHGRDEPILHAVFDGQHCEGCPLADQCPTSHSHADKWYIPVDRRLRARDEALAAQEDEEWWEAYRIRSGAEATVSEMVRAHGMDKLRVRGRKRVELEVGLKAAACNVKRWLRGVDAGDTGPLWSDMTSIHRDPSMAANSGRQCFIGSTARHTPSVPVQPAGWAVQPPRIW